MDVFFQSLPKDVKIISGYQKTPRTLSICISEKDFFRILEFLPEGDLIFKFLERRSKEKIFVHFAFLKERVTLQIAIEVTNPSQGFGKSLCGFFPPAVAYLAEL